jgi:hypothetical protein
MELGYHNALQNAVELGPCKIQLAHDDELGPRMTATQHLYDRRDVLYRSVRLLQEYHWNTYTQAENLKYVHGLKIAG